MPFKDPIKRREYERKYHLERYKHIRAEWIIKLGGKCIECGATEDLQLDHRDRKQKLFEVSEVWGLPKESLIDELEKCQLLCRSCHKKKTSFEVQKGHGTWGMYRNRKCRCEVCRGFVAAYMRKRRNEKT